MLKPIIQSKRVEGSGLKFLSFEFWVVVFSPSSFDPDSEGRTTLSKGKLEPLLPQDLYLEELLYQPQIPFDLQAGSSA